MMETLIHRWAKAEDRRFTRAVAWGLMVLIVWPVYCATSAPETPKTRRLGVEFTYETRAALLTMDLWVDGQYKGRRAAVCNLTPWPQPAVPTKTCGFCEALPHGQHTVEIAKAPNGMAAKIQVTVSETQPVKEDLRLKGWCTP